MLRAAVKPGVFDFTTFVHSEWPQADPLEQAPRDKGPAQAALQ
jgi:hypothetical protein